MQSLPLLSLIIWLPALGAPMALALSRHPERCRWFTLALTGVVLLLVGLLFAVHASQGGGLTEDAAWIPRLGIRYSLRADGISLLLTGLTALLTALCVLVSWRSVESGVGLFHAALLLVESSITGVFLAADLFLFYLFWEFQLIPTALIIGLWGHEKRVYAAVKFFLFSMAGSLFMLAALIGLFLLHGRQSGDYTLALGALLHTRLAPSTEGWLFLAFAAAFAIKIPLLPVHTWLPDAHTEAPTAGSVILAGLLLKTGAYGLLRYGFPLFPQAAAEAAYLLMVLGLLGLFYASWIAAAQTDMKRLVAYSSISHMGLVVIGIAAWNSLTLPGALLQMLNHGLTTAALFIMVGMLDERVKTRALAQVGGLWRKIPVFSGFFLLFGLSAMGLPGLNNFVSELLILLGTFRQQPVIACLGFAAMVATLIYLLRLLQETLFGPPLPAAEIADLSAREWCILLPLAVGVVWIGVYPAPFLDLLQEPVNELLQRAGGPMIAWLR